MDGGPGADSWETVDRKVSKKSKKKVEGEEDGSWSQVSNDKRKKEFSGTRGGRGTEGRGGERRDGGDRRGDGGDRRGDRGKPPRGGSNQRYTLPRRPGGRDRDGYGSAAGGPGAGQFSRSTPSPGRSNAQTPQIQGNLGIYHQVSLQDEFSYSISSSLFLLYVLSKYTMTCNLFGFNTCPSF